MKVLLATTNKSKIRYYGQRLIENGVDVITLNDLDKKLDIDENGKKPVENAIIKARAYGKISNLPTVALDDGLFLACESKIKQNVVMRSNLSSAVLGNEGLFNLSLSGNGFVALESPVPRVELVDVELQNDVLRIHGNFAVAWSKGLNFTVEKSTKSLIGSAVSGEGLVNVYRGTGKVLMAPVRNLTTASATSMIK